jgi:hypothetical protein
LFTCYWPKYIYLHSCHLSHRYSVTVTKSQVIEHFTLSCLVFKKGVTSEDIYTLANNKSYFFNYGARVFKFFLGCVVHYRSSVALFSLGHCIVCSSIHLVTVTASDLPYRSFRITSTDVILIFIFFNQTICMHHHSCHSYKHSLVLCYKRIW